MQKFIDTSTRAVWRSAPGSFQASTSSSPSSHSLLARLRWILPLVVFGRLAGGIKAMLRIAISCCRVTASCIHFLTSWKSRPFRCVRSTSCTIANLSFPSSSVTENAAPQPLRNAG